MLNTLADSVLKRIRRSSFYYGRYNNTLDFKTNQAYTRYARECSERYASMHPDHVIAPSRVHTQAAELIENAFSAEKARAYSSTITRLIESNDGAVEHPKNEDHLSLKIKDPLRTLGADLLDVLRNPGVNQAIIRFFKGYYRVEWAVCYRSLASNRVASSWLWHSDCFPPHTCKLFVHLTSANAETGATEFMNLDDTMAYRRAGYFGQQLDERYADLQEFAAAHNLPYRPIRLDAAPGDATLFDMNFFHRAVPPTSGIRDVVQFFFLPSPIPWDEHLKRTGIERLSSQTGGPPKDPRNQHVGAATGAAMM